MVYTPNFRVTPTFLRVLTLLARLVGAVFVLVGVLFVLSAFAATTLKLPYLLSAVFLIVSGLGLRLAKGPTVADSERWRRKMGFRELDDQ